MDAKRYISINKGILKWLSMATIVLSLVVFSERLPGSERFQKQEVKTELPESCRLDSKRTVDFYTIHPADRSPLQLAIEILNFQSYLLLYEGSIKEAIKRIAKEFSTIDKRKKVLLIFYSRSNFRQVSSVTRRG